MRVVRCLWEASSSLNSSVVCRCVAYARGLGILLRFHGCCFSGCVGREVSVGRGLGLLRDLASLDLLAENVCFAFACYVESVHGRCVGCAVLPTWNVSVITNVHAAASVQVTVPHRMMECLMEVLGISWRPRYFTTPWVNDVSINIDLHGPVVWFGIGVSAA